MHFSEAIPALAYAGIGAGLGTIGASIVNSRSGRGEARAHAADMISEAASGLADRQAATSKRLSLENEKMRKAIMMLSDVLDELLPQLSLDKVELTKLKKATIAAKLAV